MKKYNKIFCPCCNAEYLMSEIYVPKAFVGCPIDIDKNNLGKIRKVIGEYSSMDESYTCDYCDTKFYVTARVTFKTSNKPFDGFDGEYVIKKESKVELDEG